MVDGVICLVERDVVLVPLQAHVGEQNWVIANPLPGELQKLLLGELGEFIGRLLVLQSKVSDLVADAAELAAATLLKEDVGVLRDVGGRWHIAGEPGEKC